MFHMEDISENVAFSCLLDVNLRQLIFEIAISGIIMFFKQNVKLRL